MLQYGLGFQWNAYIGAFLQIIMFSRNTSQIFGQYQPSANNLFHLHQLEIISTNCICSSVIILRLLFVDYYKWIKWLNTTFIAWIYAPEWMQRYCKSAQTVFGKYINMYIWCKFMNTFNLRDLEGSYFCFTDQSMAALVWLRAAMLSSVPGVEIQLHTSHSILLLPMLNLKRRIERALQSMNGRGNRIFNSNCFSYKMVTLRLKNFIVIVETFFAGDTKENCQSLKQVSVHYRNKAWIKNIGILSF